MTKKRPAQIRDAAVEAATGKTWSQWFRILDSYPKNKSHTERAAWLFQHHLKKGWWTQMVTVTYEQARGLRQKHQTTTGFRVSVNKTLPISVHQLYRWITVATKRKLWLTNKFAITRNQPGKSVRVRWADGTRVDISLYAKGTKKSSIQLQHEKLPTQKIAKQKQVWWRQRVARLAEVI